MEMMTDPSSEGSGPAETTDDDGVSAWERVFAAEASPARDKLGTGEGDSEEQEPPPPSSTEVTESGTEPDNEPAQELARRRSLLATIATAVLALALVAATTAAVVEWRRADRLNRREADRLAIATAAGKLGQALLSYDYTNLNAARTTVLSLSTDKFAQYYTTAFTNGLSAAVTQLQAKATASVRKVFVADTNGDTADVFVVLDSEVHSSAGTRQLTGSYLDLAMVRQGGHWKVDGVTSIAATSDNLTPPGATPGSPAPSTSSTTPTPSSSVPAPGR
jgi:Mce-associated membrane protein